MRENYLKARGEQQNRRGIGKVAKAVSDRKEGEGKLQTDKHVARQQQQQVASGKLSGFQHYQSKAALLTPLYLILCPSYCLCLSFVLLSFPLSLHFSPLLTPL